MTDKYPADVYFCDTLSQTLCDYTSVIWNPQVNVTIGAVICMTTRRAGG